MNTQEFESYRTAGLHKIKKFLDAGVLPVPPHLRTLLLESISRFSMFRQSPDSKSFPLRRFSNLFTHYPSFGFIITNYNFKFLIYLSSVFFMNSCIRINLFIQIDSPDAALAYFLPPEISFFFPSSFPPYSSPVHFQKILPKEKGPSRARFHFYFSSPLIIGGLL